MAVVQCSGKLLSDWKNIPVFYHDKRMYQQVNYAADYNLHFPDVFKFRGE